MHAFLRKSPLCRSHFFEWLKTAISSTACGRVTLKSLLPQGAYAPHVHPRLRKRPPRCTLDCGFKTPESPALRGFKAERCPITGTSLYLVLKSNGLRHSKNFPVKFDFSPKTVLANIVQKLSAHSLLKSVFFRISTSLTNAPRSLSQAKVGIHTCLCSKDRTQRLTRRNRGLPSPGHSVALCRQWNLFYSTTLLYTYISRFSVTLNTSRRE